MAITKQDIDNVSLNIVSEGYDPEEVDLLLERIAKEVDTFNRSLAAAATRVEQAEARAQAAEQQAAQSAHLASAAGAAAQTSASEHQIAQALISAQKSADDLKDTARIESEKAFRDAEKRARDIVRDALSEKQRIIDEVERLRESTETFRSEYMSLLGRFTTEAQKAMPKLEDARPNFEQEKKETAEAIRLIKEADTAFEAPEPEPEAAAQSAPVFDAISSPAKASPDASQNTSSISAQAVQSSFQLDEDLDIDIEEID